MILAETIQVPQKLDRSKTITTQIPISIDSDGYPELPTVSMADGYKTKVVQSMLRDYCTAHIREPSFYPFSAKHNTFELGFVSGKKKQIIPWGTLVKDPFSWISEECIPDGFEWKDPSKIQIGEVFRLLYHWRHRQDQGLDPLTWLPTCPIFQDAEQPLRHGRNLHQVREEQPQVSDEEVFDLPSSGDVGEKEDKNSSDDIESSDKSPTRGNSEEDKDSPDDIESSDESPIGGNTEEDKDSPDDIESSDESPIGGNSEEDEDSPDDIESSDESPGGKSSEHEESIDLDMDSPPMHMSHQEQGRSSECNIYSAILVCIQCAPYYAVYLEDGGRSASPQFRHSNTHWPGQCPIWVFNMPLISLRNG
jgi:hypothetical protein